MSGIKIFIFYRKNFAGTVFNRNQSCVRFVVCTYPSEKKHLIPYGCTIYLLGDEKQCLAIMKQVYNENWKYNFENPSADDIHNFFAGITTGAINKEDYQNTVYEFLFDLTDKEIINIFVGN